MKLLPQDVAVPVRHPIKFLKDINGGYAFIGNVIPIAMTNSVAQVRWNSVAQVRCMMP